MTHIGVRDIDRAFFDCAGVIPTCLKKSGSAEELELNSLEEEGYPLEL